MGLHDPNAYGLKPLQHTLWDHFMCSCLEQNSKGFFSRTTTTVPSSRSFHCPAEKPLPTPPSFPTPRVHQSALHLQRLAIPTLHTDPQQVHGLQLPSQSQDGGHQGTVIWAVLNNAGSEHSRLFFF